MNKTDTGRRGKLLRLLRIRRALPEAIKVPLRWVRSNLTANGRALQRLEAEESGALLQPASVTSHDRHPELFALAAERLAGVEAARVLSYGCSTGEEAFTLAQYLPHAQIDAIDINPHSISIAQRATPRNLANRVTFTCAATPPKETATYDAIFCLSVLRHGRLDAERPDSCAHILPFARFAETVDALDHVLKTGGTLFFWGSNYRFADTSTAANYTLFPTPEKRPQPGPFYGPDDRLIEIDNETAFVFEKTG